MKKIFFIALISISSFSHAEAIKSDAVCISIKSMAEKAMISRQSEVPKEFIEQARESIFSESDGGVVAKLNYNILGKYIADAYQEDIHPTEAMKKVSINRIGAEAYLDCLELLKN